MEDPPPLRESWHDPLARRLPSGPDERREILTRHAAAMADRRSTYRDPRTGLSVFTAGFLADRAYCCGSGCRHCPYEQPSP